MRLPESVVRVTKYVVYVDHESFGLTDRGKARVREEVEALAQSFGARMIERNHVYWAFEAHNPMALEKELLSLYIDMDDGMFLDASGERDEGGCGGSTTVVPQTQSSRGSKALLGAVLLACVLLAANLAALLSRDTISLAGLDEYQRGLAMRSQAYSEYMIGGGTEVLVLFRGCPVDSGPRGIQTLRSSAEDIMRDIPRNLNRWRHEILECSNRDGAGFSIHSLALKGET